MDTFYFYLFNRYVHFDCINVSIAEKLEELGGSFCDIVYKNLKTNFSLYIMDIESLCLQRIFQNYGRVGKSPYITMSITKNYSSCAHDDPGDGRQSFIVWFSKSDHF